MVSSGVLLTLKDFIHKENISIETNEKYIGNESELANNLFHLILI